MGQSTGCSQGQQHTQGQVVAHAVVQVTKPARTCPHSAMTMTMTIDAGMQQQGRPRASSSSCACNRTGTDTHHKPINPGWGGRLQQGAASENQGGGAWCCVVPRQAWWLQEPWSAS